VGEDIFASPAQVREFLAAGKMTEDLRATPDELNLGVKADGTPETKEAVSERIRQSMREAREIELTTGLQLDVPRVGA
jgi:hypothetical protein